MKLYFYSIKDNKAFFTKCNASRSEKKGGFILKEIPGFSEYNGFIAKHGINNLDKKEPFVVLMGRDDVYASDLLYRYLQNEIDEKYLEINDFKNKIHIVNQMFAQEL